jgi:uncharacterized membrane protein YidH (DUF202 family)
MQNLSPRADKLQSAVMTTTALGGVALSTYLAWKYTDSQWKEKRGDHYKRDTSDNVALGLIFLVAALPGVLFGAGVGGAAFTLGYALTEGEGK